MQKKPSKSRALKTLTLEQKLRAVLHYSKGKSLSRDEIRSFISNGLLNDKKESAISAERLVGIIAGLLYVLGHSPANAHALAEEFVSQKSPRPAGTIEAFSRLLVSSKQ